MCQTAVQARAVIDIVMRTQITCNVRLTKFSEVIWLHRFPGNGELIIRNKKEPFELGNVLFRMDKYRQSSIRVKQYHVHD